MIAVLIALGIACGNGTTAAQSASGRSLAPTPPMGWNSWNKFACNVSEELIRETADAMVSSGMQAAGYQYVNIDDCWQVSRDAQGTIVDVHILIAGGLHAAADHGVGSFTDEFFAHVAGKFIPAVPAHGWRQRSSTGGLRGRRPIAASDSQGNQDSDHEVSTGCHCSPSFCDVH